MDFAAVLLKVQSIGLIVIAVLVALPGIFRAIEGALHSIRLALLAIPGNQAESAIEKVESWLESVAAGAQKVADVVGRLYSFLFPQLPKADAPAAPKV